MIRPLRLTDLWAYLAFRNRAALNEALLRPEDSPSSPSLRNGFLGRSFELGRQSWVHIENGQLVGLVAARPRIGGDVWDIDQLVVLPSGDAHSVYRDLLGHLAGAARDAGVQKVFLRVRSDSPVQLSARRAGFFEYTRETVYHLREHAAALRPGDGPFRPRRRVHHQAIFQLYNSAVPCQVREVEGMTLHEWRLVDGWGFRPPDFRVAFSPRRRDFVLEQDGKVATWGHIDLPARRVHLLGSADRPDALSAALRHALGLLGPNGHVICPVRAYQPELVPLLVERGFVPQAEHTLLAQSLAVRLPQRQFLPARA